jgi:O-antigen ligase
LTVPFFFIHDGRASFRIIKTAVVFLPLLSVYSLNNPQYRLSKAFYWFMMIAALLVCIDFVLYFITGTMIMGGTESGFLPRPRGLMEDSNFFSYLMLVYIFYLKKQEGRYNYLLVLSLILSGSLAAISCFLLLSLFYRFTDHVKLSKSKLIKYLTLIITGISFFVYFNTAFNYNKIMENVEVSEMDGLEKVKFYSLMLRFGAQNEALMLIDSPSKILFGIGAGNTKNFTEREMNLHNTYLQLFLEQGLIVFVLFALLILLMALKIHDTYYVILFCVIFMLGTILEVFYFPLLSFIFFISHFSNKGLYEDRVRAII